MKLPERTFIFVRHGETEFNRVGRFQGRTDVPLNPNGHAQARAAANVLATYEISRIVSSPAQRVLQTVRPFVEANDLPLQIDDDLMEFFVGSFEGQFIESIRKTHRLQQGHSWLTVLPDDADRWHEFVPRVCAAVRRWTEQHADESILIASHGLVFRALTEVLVGKQVSSGNAEVHCFRRSDEGWVVSPLSAAEQPGFVPRS